MADLPPRPLIRFLGAARTVTGSRFLVETPTARLLVDCGMFQGTKELRLRNWAGFPVSPDTIDAVVVSHAHLDHVGYVPALVRDGFAGSVFSTTFTKRLAEVVLEDSGRIQEEDAERANRKGYTKHRPALPLYTEADAVEAVTRFRETRYTTRTAVADGVHISLHRAGHILGAASVLVEFDDGTPPLHISGDLGRPFHPVLAPPDPPPQAETVVIESTYGDTDHVDEDGTEALGRVIARTADRGGSVIIPAFAVDRTEVILHALRQLTLGGTIPRLPVFLDSPMARSALVLYLRAVDEGHPEIRPELAGHPEIFDPGDLTITESVTESKSINHVDPPLVIVSASGMATGGRVLHHLKRCLPDERSSVVLVGYQAAGTRGDRLLRGEPTLRIHGEDIPVRAEIVSVPAFSVHADQDELVGWLDSAPTPPRQVLAVHGDPEAADTLVRLFRDERGWDARAPRNDERVFLDR